MFLFLFGRSGDTCDLKTMLTVFKGRPLGISCVATVCFNNTKKIKNKI